MGSRGRGQSRREGLGSRRAIAVLSYFSPPVLCSPCKRRLLWMLPLEGWQEVLGFCPFQESSRMTRTLTPASREFYFLLKQSLLEMCFWEKYSLPQHWRGLWIASRDALATRARVLHLGVSRVFFLVIFFCSLVTVEWLPCIVQTHAHTRTKQTNKHRTFLCHVSPGGASALSAEASGEFEFHGRGGRGASTSGPLRPCTAATAGVPLGEVNRRVRQSFVRACHAGSKKEKRSNRFVRTQQKAWNPLESAGTHMQ